MSAEVETDTHVRNYIRLRQNYFEHPVIMACADEVPAALHLWPILIGKARMGAHGKENPDGAIRTTLAKLARDAYVSIDDVAPALALMEEGELLSVAVEGRNAVRIVIHKLFPWQTMPGTSAARVANYRANASRLKCSACNAPETDPLRVDNAEREGEREGEDVSVVTNVTTSPAGKPARQREPKDPIFVADKASVDGCFEFYCDLWEKRGMYALDLTASRRSRIGTAIRKHGKRVVADVIRYHHANDWRHESLDRNDILILLREKNIQAAIEGMRGNPTTTKRSVGSLLSPSWNGR